MSKVGETSAESSGSEVSDQAPEQTHIFGVPMDDVKKLRDLDKETIEKYDMKVTARRSREKMLKCAGVITNFCFIIILLFAMSWFTSQTLKKADEMKYDCSKNGTFDWHW